jgi:chorismate synthase
MSSSFGQIFRISTFGESHGGAVGVVVDGCPPRLPISLEEVQADLDRRKPGQSRITTSRQEADQAEIVSGLFEGQTLGTPIGIVVRRVAVERVREKPSGGLRRAQSPASSSAPRRASKCWPGCDASTKSRPRSIPQP